VHERHRQTGQDRQRTDSIGRTVLQTVAQKWFALCYRTVVCHVCLSLLSVTLVYCGQTVEWIKTKLGMMVGLGHIVLDGDPAPRQKGAQPRIFGPCLFWPNGWMDQDATWYGDRLLLRRHCVRWAPSSPPKKRAQPPIFGPYLFWPNGWMHQDTTWYGGRPGRSRHCVRWGPSSPSKGGTAPNFRPMSVVANRLYESRCHLVRR